MCFWVIFIALCNQTIIVEHIECFSLLSFASCALEFGYVCPELTEDNVIDVRKGRYDVIIT